MARHRNHSPESMPCIRLIEPHSIPGNHGSPLKKNWSDFDKNRMTRLKAPYGTAHELLSAAFLLDHFFVEACVSGARTVHG